MRPPIVLNESGSVAFFRDIESLLRYLEPIDVANGEYVAYDRDGRLIHLHSEKLGKKALFGLLHDEVYTPVKAEEEREPAHVNELRSMLVDALESTGSIAGQTQHDEGLQHLLAVAIERFGYTK